MNIRCIDMNVVPGQPEENMATMLQAIETEKENGTDIVIFPELCVSGYLLGDRWQSNAFAKSLLPFNEKIIEASKGITVIWGNIDIDEHKQNPDGTVRKYNAAYISHGGELLGKTYKTHLPSYGEFSDHRYFTSLKTLAEEEGKTLTDVLQNFQISNPKSQAAVIGVTICEDIWQSPNIASLLYQKGSRTIINLSCSTWYHGKRCKHEKKMQELATKCPEASIYFCNPKGWQDCGKTLLYFDGNRTEPDPTIRDVLIDGIRTFFERTAKQKAIIGLSGGIDSAVSAALCCEALGPKNVYAFNLATRYNSETTKKNARQIAENLGVHFSEIDIDEDIESLTKKIESRALTAYSLQLTDLDKENLQARTRGALYLQTLAGALNGLVICNGNKTEFAFGYATLYGDILGAIAPLGDLLKTDVYSLGRSINEQAEREVIPALTFDLPPSAELSPEHNVDEGKGDPFWYPYHDQLVRWFVEEHRQPEEVLEWYREGVLIEKICDVILSPTKDASQCIMVRRAHHDTLKDLFPTSKAFTDDFEDKWNRFTSNVFKRLQAPPVIKVRPRSFGFDYREALFLRR